MGRHSPSWALPTLSEGLMTDPSLTNSLEGAREESEGSQAWPLTYNQEHYGNMADQWELDPSQTYYEDSLNIILHF